MRRLLLTAALSTAPALASAQCEIHEFVAPVTLPFGGYGSFDHEDGRTVISTVDSASGVTDAGVVHVIEYGPSGFEIVKKVYAPTPQTDDFFGTPVLLDHDRLVAGAWGAGNGAVHVFEREGDDWNVAGTLTASDGAPATSFGQAVDIDGDRVVVGAGTAGATGAAYVFERIGGVWQETAKLTPNESHPVNYFGRSVAVSGDRILVGAPTVSGVAGSQFEETYVFELGQTGWVQTTKLDKTGAGVGSWFGTNVRLDGDLAAVIAPIASNPGCKIGKCYLYEHENGVWKTVDVITPTIPQGGFFGASLDLREDRVAIGSTAGALFWGGEPTVEVFLRDGDDWKLELFMGGSEYVDSFGRWVDLRDDALMVGWLHGGVSNYTGRATLYSLPRQAKLMAGHRESSAAAGATQTMSIRACANWANHPYRIVGSITGTGPGPSIDGHVVPLTVDWYTSLTVSAPNATLLGWGGALDADGRADATFVLPPTNDPSLVGLEFHHAGLIFSPVTQKVVDVTDAASVRLVP